MPQYIRKDNDLLRECLKQLALDDYLKALEQERASKREKSQQVQAELREEMQRRHL